MVRNRVDPLNSKVGAISDDVDTIRDRLNTLKESVEKSNSLEAILAEQSKTIDRMAEDIGQEETRRVVANSELRDYVEKI